MLFKFYIFSFFFIGFLLSGCASRESKNSSATSSILQLHVLVLGTVHLSDDDTQMVRRLPELIKILKAWGPTKIAVEDRRPDLIRNAVVRSQFDQGYKKLLEFADGSDVLWSDKFSKKYKISYELALKKIHENLSKEKDLSEVERAKLIQYLIITYDIPSAVLHWTKLSLAFQKSTRQFSKDDKKELLT